MKNTFDIGVNAEIKYDSVLVNRLYDGLSTDEKTAVQAHIIEKIAPLKLYQLMLSEHVAKVIDEVDKTMGDDDTKPLKLTPEIVIANGFEEDFSYKNKGFNTQNQRYFKIPMTHFANRAIQWLMVYDITKCIFWIEDDPTIQIVSVNQFKLLLKLWGLDDVLNDFKYR